MQDAGMDDSEARMTVAEAAERLSITKEAVRKRIHRGTLRSDRAPDGTVMVYIPPSPTPDGTPSSSDRDLLYEEMRERIADLRTQLEAERTSSAELRRIVAALTQRIPEIEAADASSVSPQSREEAAQEPAEASSGAAADFNGGTGPQKSSERVSWWRRMFGG